MSLRGVFTSLVFGVISALIALYNVKYAFIIFAAVYLLKALIQVKSKDVFNKYQKLVNIDKYNEYIKKDKIFKKFIKSDPIADIMVAGLFIYMSFRQYNTVNNINYAIMVFSFIMINYFVDIYAMKTSDTWEEYKKKNMFSGIILLLIVLFII